MRRLCALFCALFAFVSVSVPGKVGAQSSDITTYVSWDFGQRADGRRIESVFKPLSTFGTARVHYGTAIDKLSDESASVNVSQGWKRVFIPIVFLAPGVPNYYRVIISLSNGQKLESDIGRIEMPEFTNGMPVESVSGDSWHGNPCEFLQRRGGEGRPSDSATFRVSLDAAVTCGYATFHPSVFKGSGQSGRLVCPARFARNLNWSKVEFTIPKIGLPLTFGSGTEYARESVHVRFNQWISGANSGEEGNDQPLRQGFQKWDATNWTPYTQHMYQWIWCSDNFSAPQGHLTIN